MKYCSHCGSPVEEGEKFCKVCGEKLNIQGEPTEAQFSYDLYMDMDHFKNCPYCGAAIRKEAKRCPNCGKKLSMGKGVFIILGMFVLFVIAIFLLITGVRSLSANRVEDPSGPSIVIRPSESEESPIEESRESRETRAQGEDDVPVFTMHVGDTHEDQNVNILYLGCGEYTEANDYMAPKKGYKYIFFNLSIQNIGHEEQVISTLYTKCYADNYEMEEFYGGLEFLSVNLSPGRIGNGCLYYEVPVDAKEIVLEYDLDWRGTKKARFVYDGDVVSNLAVPKSFERSAGAIPVGQTYEGRNLKVTCQSAEIVDGKDYYMEPREGYEFRTCTFEVKNKSVEAANIGTYCFSCYADGVSCPIVYLDNETLNGEAKPGKNIKGTISIEVPIDAQVVEIEYLEDFMDDTIAIFEVK